MKKNSCKYALALAALLAGTGPLRAQVSQGPITPAPGEPVQQAPPDAQAKLKFGVALVDMPVTVFNTSGEMVHDLTPSDFLITDNGIPQKISHFDLGGDPVSVVILIETSSRIASLMPEIHKTGILFTQTVMGPNGEGAVVGFDDAIDKLVDFTTNADPIEKTISGLQTGSPECKLYDAMAVGVEMLSDRPQPTPQNPGRRRILLVMSEAKDIGSEAKLGEVLRKAQLANVTIYSVALSTTRAEFHSQDRSGPSPIAPPGIMTMPGPPGIMQTPTTVANENSAVDLLGIAIWAVQHIKDEVKEHPLEVATVGTGGTYIPTYKDRSIENAIDEIGGELHSQYIISYAPTDGTVPGYHEIKVQLDRKDSKDFKIRARPGYYVAPPES